MSTTVDPLCLAAQSVASEAKAYKMLRSLRETALLNASVSMRQLLNRMEGRFMFYCWNLSLGRACNTSVKRETQDEILADYLCEKHRDSIFAAMFRQPWILPPTVSFMRIGLHGTSSKFFSRRCVLCSTIRNQCRRCRDSDG